MKSILFIIVVSFNYIGYCQSKDVRIDYKLLSDKYVSKSYDDSLLYSEYDGVGTFSKEIKNNRKFPKRKLSVIIDTSKVVKFYEDYNGYRLYIANTTKDSVSMVSYCGSLDVVAEAYIDGNWQFIEWHGYMCGNCFGWDILQKGHYWEFAIPKFTGEIKTKLRYSLHLAGGTIVYSNEIEAKINRGQVTNNPMFGSDWISLMKD